MVCDWLFGGVPGKPPIKGNLTIDCHALPSCLDPPGRPEASAQLSPAENSLRGREVSKWSCRQETTEHVQNATTKGKTKRKQYYECGSELKTKVTKEANRRFWSLVPFSKVPFWYICLSRSHRELYIPKPNFHAQQNWQGRERALHISPPFGAASTQTALTEPWRLYFRVVTSSRTAPRSERLNSANLQ